MRWGGVEPKWETRSAVRAVLALTVMAVGVAWISGFERAGEVTLVLLIASLALALGLIVLATSGGQGWVVGGDRIETRARIYFVLTFVAFAGVSAVAFISPFVAWEDWVDDRRAGVLFLAWLGTPFGFVFFVYASVASLVRRPRLVLTRDGLEQYGISRDEAIRWDEIDDIDAEDGVGGRLLRLQAGPGVDVVRRIHWPWGWQRHQRRHEIILAMASFADAQSVFELVGECWVEEDLPAEWVERLEQHPDD